MSIKVGSTTINLSGVDRKWIGRDEIVFATFDLVVDSQTIYTVACETMYRFNKCFYVNDRQLVQDGLQLNVEIVNAFNSIINQKENYSLLMDEWFLKAHG